MTANIHKGLAVGKIPLNIISGEGEEVPECYTHFRGSHGLIRGLRHLRNPQYLEHKVVLHGKTELFLYINREHLNVFLAPQPSGSTSYSAHFLTRA